MKPNIKELKQIVANNRAIAFQEEEDGPTNLKIDMPKSRKQNKLVKLKAKKGTAGRDSTLISLNAKDKGTKRINPHRLNSGQNFNDSASNSML